MKYIKFGLVASIFTGSTAFAQHSLTVNISNLKPSKGNLEIGLFNKAAGFLKEGLQYKKKTVKAAVNSQTVTFENLPSGEYALAIFQDENLNKKCDTNFLGVPTEGFGFSNNFKPTISAPNFNQTKFTVNGDKTIAVKLLR